jgi:hypothetical protein
MGKYQKKKWYLPLLKRKIKEKEKKRKEKKKKRKKEKKKYKARKNVYITKGTICNISYKEFKYSNK